MSYMRHLTRIPGHARVLGPAVALLLAGALAHCKPSAPLDPLAEQGKQVYMAHCIACHATDPARDGSLGPAVAGSSLELLRARILEGGYPPGYQPKRASTIMQKLSLSDQQIEALTAYLNPAPPAAEP